MLVYPNRHKKEFRHNETSVETGRFAKGSTKNRPLAIFHYQSVVASQVTLSAFAGR